MRVRPYWSLEGVGESRNGPDICGAEEITAVSGAQR